MQNVHQDAHAAATSTINTAHANLIKVRDSHNKFNQNQDIAMVQAQATIAVASALLAIAEALGKRS